MASGVEKISEVSMPRRFHVNAVRDFLIMAGGNNGDNLPWLPSRLMVFNVFAVGINKHLAFSDCVHG